jgi:hypothetical protein
MPYSFLLKPPAAAAANAYCDATPWNLLVAHDLCSRLTEATFVLSIRHYIGAIQSLQRSYEQGHRFAGANLEPSTKVWARFYSQAVFLPQDRALAVSLDRLYPDPVSEISRLKPEFARRSLDIELFEPSVFAESHAVPAGLSRPTIARLVNGTLQADGRPPTGPGGLDHRGKEPYQDAELIGSAPGTVLNSVRHWTLAAVGVLRGGGAAGEK